MQVATIGVVIAGALTLLAPTASARLQVGDGQVGDGQVNEGQGSDRPAPAGSEGEPRAAQAVWVDPQAGELAPGQVLVLAGDQGTRVLNLADQNGLLLAEVAPRTPLLVHRELAGWLLVEPPGAFRSGSSDGCSSPPRSPTSTASRRTA